MKIKFWNISFVLIGIALISFMIAKITRTVQFANKNVTSLPLFDSILFVILKYLLVAILLSIVYWCGKRLFIRWKIEFCDLDQLLTLSKLRIDKSKIAPKWSRYIFVHYFILEVLHHAFQKTCATILWGFEQPHTLPTIPSAPISYFGMAMRSRWLTAPRWRFPTRRKTGRSRRCFISYIFSPVEKVNKSRYPSRGFKRDSNN